MTTLPPAHYAHSVCFRCRKSWAPPTTRSRRYARLAAPDTRPCPDCGAPLIGLGLAFNPPKRSDRRAWQKLEAAARAGNRFLKP
jgi:hypothetical protein